MLGAPTGFSSSDCCGTKGRPHARLTDSSRCAFLQGLLSCQACPRGPGSHAACVWIIKSRRKEIRADILNRALSLKDNNLAAL